MAQAAIDGVIASKDAVAATRQQNLLLWVTLLLSSIASVAGAISAWAAHRGLTGLERPYIWLRDNSIEYRTVWKAIPESERQGRPLTERDRELSIEFSTTFKNYGRAPCRVDQLHITFTQARSLDKAIAHAGLEACNPQWVFTETGSREERFRRYIPLSTYEYEAFVEGREYAFVKGEIHYSDAMGNPYKRRFCFRLVHDSYDNTEEYGGRKHNSDQRVRRRSEAEVHLRAWLRLARSGFRRVRKVDRLSRPI